MDLRELFGHMLIDLSGLRTRVVYVVIYPRMCNDMYDRSCRYLLGNACYNINIHQLVWAQQEDQMVALP